MDKRLENKIVQSKIAIVNNVIRRSGKYEIDDHRLNAITVDHSFEETELILRKHWKLADKLRHPVGYVKKVWKRVTAKW